MPTLFELLDEPAPISTNAPTGEGPELLAAVARADALRERGGWAYLLALREVNGWASGFYPEGSDA